MARHSEQVSVTLESASKSLDGITSDSGTRCLNIAPMTSGGTTEISVDMDPALKKPECKLESRS